MQVLTALRNWSLPSALVVSVLSLAACRTTTDTSVDYQDRGLRPVQSPLNLKHFDIIDTQGLSSITTSSGNFRIDPRNNSGEFSLSWDANFTYDYRATLYVSPTIFAGDGRKIAYNNCGFGYSCGFTGSAFCGYSLDYSVSCGSNSSVDLSDWIKPGSRQLFFVLELCDTRTLNCQQDFQEVTFY